MNAIGYLRTPTQRQTGEAEFELASYKEQIRRYAITNNITIVEWLTDNDVSGNTEDRPAFERIIYGDVTNPPYQAVIAANNGQIAQDVYVYFYYKMLLYKKGITLISVSEDFGQFGFSSTILEAFAIRAAQMERDSIAKRTSIGRITKSEQGGYAGGKAPYGYYAERGSGKLIVNPEEIPLVRRIFEIRDNGGTMKEIVQTLRTEGFKTRKGTDFQISTIQYILGNRKTYEGFYKYGKTDEWVQGAHEPILKAEELHKVAKSKEVLTMTSREAILELLKKQGKTKANLAALLGISQATLWDRLAPKKKSITIITYNEMLRALDYELVIMPRGKAEEVEDAYIVNDEILLDES